MQRIFTGLDILKIVAAVGIVAIHTGTPVFNTFGRLGVPFFAITSSFLFFKKYLTQNKDDQLGDLKHFLKRLLILYLCWQAVYLPSAAIYFIQDVHRFGNSKGTIYFLRHFLFPPLPLTNGWGQSWYLIGMLIGLPVFLILLKLFRTIGMGIVSVLLYLFYISYNSNFNSWHFARALPHPIYYLLGTIGNNSFPILLIYIYLGLIIAILLPKILAGSGRSFAAILSIVIILFFIENIIIWSQTGKIDNLTVVMTAPASLMMVLWGIKWQASLQQDLFWRQFSTFLFCIHVGIIHVFDVAKMVLHVSINSFIVMVATVVISYLLFLVFKRLMRMHSMMWLKWFV